MPDFWAISNCTKKEQKKFRKKRAIFEKSQEGVVEGRGPGHLENRISIHQIPSRHRSKSSKARAAGPRRLDSILSCDKAHAGQTGLLPATAKTDAGDNDTSLNGMTSIVLPTILSLAENSAGGLSLNRAPITEAIQIPGFSCSCRHSVSLIHS